MFEIRVYFKHETLSMTRTLIRPVLTWSSASPQRCAAAWWGGRRAARGWRSPPCRAGTRRTTGPACRPRRCLWGGCGREVMRMWAGLCGAYRAPLARIRPERFVLVSTLVQVKYVSHARICRAGRVSLFSHRSFTRYRSLTLCRDRCRHIHMRYSKGLCSSSLVVSMALLVARIHPSEHNHEFDVH